MSRQKQNDSLYSNKNLLHFILKNKKHLIIVIIIAVIASVTVSFLIRPKFKSSVILFTTASSSTSQSLVTLNTQKNEFLKFGEDEDIEQFMQMLMSTEVQKIICAKYDLFNHYRIPTNTTYPQTKLYKEYKSNVKIFRTEFMSIGIDVYDESADTAVLIANDIAKYADSLFTTIKKVRAQKAYNIVEQEYLAQKEKIKFYEDTLKSLNNIGVLDVEKQTEMYSQQYVTALISGNTRVFNDVESRLKTLETYASTYNILQDQVESANLQLALIEAKYREVKIDLEENLPNIYIVNAAEKAEKKATPIRWLIVSVSTICSLLLAIVVLLLFRNLKKEEE